MKYINKPIRKYLNELWAKKPAPGGGSAAALSGALGCSLIGMVANYSKKNVKLKKIISLSRTYRNDFMRLLDEDITAYKRLSASYKKDKLASKKLQRIIMNATDVPLEILKKSEAAMRLCKDLVKICNKSLISDIGCAAYNLLSSFESALFNVRINLKLLNDKSLKKNLIKKASSSRSGIYKEKAAVINELNKRI